MERAREYYSFSHLTFHEYFTARKIAQRPTPEELTALASKIHDKHWREVILLTVEQLDDATDFFLALKQTIDNSVATDEEIQEYLQYLEEIVNSLAGQYENEILIRFKTIKFLGY